MNELNKNQKMAVHAISLAIGGTGFYYGVKNWKKSGWWKALAVVTGLGIPFNVKSLAVEGLEQNKQIEI